MKSLKPSAEKDLLKRIYFMAKWRNSTKTLYWLLKDFSFLSVLKILRYQLKKRTKRLNVRKVYEVKFKFGGRKLKFKLRENDDDFSILRGVFLLGSVLLPNHEKFKTVLDGGAHIGMTSTYFGITNPGSKVYCFEPSKNNLELLKYNLESNSINAEILPIAISDKKEKIGFSFNELNPSYSKVTGEGKDLIEADSLDNIIKTKKLNSVDLLKLDIEGEEIKALNGLVKENSKVREFLCENHYNMYDSQELMKLIKSKGFKLINLPHYDIVYRGIKEKINSPPLIYGKK